MLISNRAPALISLPETTPCVASRRPPALKLTVRPVPDREDAGEIKRKRTLRSKGYREFVLRSVRIGQWEAIAPRRSSRNETILPNDIVLLSMSLGISSHRWNILPRLDWTRLHWVAPGPQQICFENIVKLPLVHDFETFAQAGG
jgi:hypothetical protein